MKTAIGKRQRDSADSRRTLKGHSSRVTSGLLLLLLLALPTASITAHAATLHQDADGFTTHRPAMTTEMVYQSFAIEPMDQTTAIGSTVTLPCRVLNRKGPIQWTKDDFGLGAVRNLTGYERYTMIGSDEEGKLKNKSRSCANFHNASSSRVLEPGLWRIDNECPEVQPFLRLKK
ncbi:PREDICTED: uncharacterized protein LOC105361988 [Ceratosolen solmsi marchali]|uniref:Uncharacterized protein LOC105361988 n=1 Tax=Ceratosolen solmsi marchali TaxID=326594 RepID=A0AAJ6YGH4_9HYME|nr:PREDICTED: uncharacterized protein LOC105361988 [Ceratosolen solmsi marchali]